MAHPAYPGSDTPVLIVGGGPVGLTMALLLARHGIRCVLAEGRAAPRETSAPKAHVVNPRSLEILRSIGLDVEAIRAAGTPGKDQKWSYFMTRLTGQELGRIALDVPPADADAMTPTPLLNIAQPRFESFLRDAVAAQANIEVLLAHTFTACRADRDTVVSVFDSDRGTREVRSAFLIGADGANSAVRDALAIPMSGNPALRPRVTIHFEADLRAIVKDRPAILYWILDPSVAGTFIAYDIDRTWVYTPRAMPETFDRALYSDAFCETMIRNAIGCEDVSLAIKHVVPWMMASEVATHYRRDRAFLIGDAAHRFPPTGGFGLNTGLQDAHNLAWKLAQHLRNPDGPDVLDSYEAERRPIAEINARQSLHNSERLPVLFRLANDTIADGRIKEGDRARLQSEIATHREHFLSPGLQLGFSYGPPVRGPRDPTRFVASAGLGDRLPHAWMRRDGQRLSTLDLLDPTRFTLLAAGGEAAAWASRMRGRDLHVVTMDDRFRFETEWLATVGLSAGGLLLIRPDGHVALPATEAGGEGREKIEDALQRWCVETSSAVLGKT